MWGLCLASVNMGINKKKMLKWVKTVNFDMFSNEIVKIHINNKKTFSTYEGKERWIHMGGR